MTEDERAIRNLVDTWMFATQKGDIETVLNLMSDDVVTLAILRKQEDGRWVLARDANLSSPRSLLGRFHSRRGRNGQHRVTLEPYAWRWYRVGAPDNVLDRSDLSGRRHDAPTARDPGKA